MTITLDLGPDALEQLAQRVAEILADRHEQPANTGYLDVAAAADYLACPTSRVYALVSANRIPVHRDGSRLLFDRAELRDYINHGGAKRP